MIKMAVPEWLSEVNVSSCPCCKTGSKGKKNFVDKTLAGISNLFEGEFFREKYANKNGFLQGINPGVKLVAMLFLVVALSISTNIYLILAVYVLALILAYMSGVGIRFFILRAWFFIPFFAGIISLPSIFGFFTPGEPLITFFALNGIPIAITIQGIKGTAIFVMRVAASISLVVLLTLTTRWNNLLCALSIVKVPQIFILTLGMTYRYIFLLLKTMQDMHLAKKSRSIGNLKIAKEHGWVASSIAGILRKSYMLSEDVHLAMISRGFDGNFKFIRDNKVRMTDYVFAGFSFFTGILIILMNTNLL